jgi:hypothetical protein
MRFTAVVNLPVIVFALAVGAAARPGVSSHQQPDPMVVGRSHYFFFFSSAFNILLLDSPIGLDFEGPTDS